MELAYDLLKPEMDDSNYAVTADTDILREKTWWAANIPWLITLKHSW